MLICLLPTKAFAQRYPISRIPDSLKKGASVVKRYEEIVYEIKSPSRATLHEHYVYSILDESGKYRARYRTGYDKFISIGSISCRLIDAQGNEIKHVSKKDMQDESGTDDESLISDTRYKVNEFYSRDYPYTVEYEEDDDISGIMDLPDWSPQSDPDESVQVSRFVLVAPKDYAVRYKNMNLTLQPEIKESGGKKTYTWELDSLSVKDQESLAPSWNSICPKVLMAPSAFEAQGYAGDMSSWESFGKFLYQLMQGRDQLPPNVKAQVHQLTDGVSDPRRKISLLYEFLQQNTRYISVQLGIGGWQPFDATYVATKRYGDCKALSNYLVALLKEAGIEGKYVVIRARTNAPAIISDFPEPQFNHVIACVPLGKDTVWLECTSQDFPAGYLGAFTSDRYGLMVDEHGGTLVRTPRYGARDNLQQRVLLGAINDQGDLNASLVSLYQAERQDALEERIHTSNKDEMDHYLKTFIDLPTYDVIGFNYQSTNIRLPAIQESLKLTSPNYAQVSGRRLFILPNIVTRSESRPKADAGRRQDFVSFDEFRDVDSVELQVPGGYRLETMPAPIHLETPFGSFESACTFETDRLRYHRTYERRAGKFSAKSYSDYVNFLQQVYKYDHTRTVLVKAD